MNNFINFLTQEQTLTLALFFLITTINQIVSTLRSIFVANKAGFMAYLMVGFDALLYTFLVKSLTQQTAVTITIFVLGRIIGTYIGNMIESKIAIGIYEVEVYVKDHERQKLLQSKLLENDFSSTMNLGTITDNNVRWSNNIHIKRKDMNKLYEIFDEIGLEDPTMVVRPAKKVTGKIEEHL